jgi:hypothetical protein
MIREKCILKFSVLNVTVIMSLRMWTLSEYYFNAKVEIQFRPRLPGKTNLKIIRQKYKTDNSSRLGQFCAVLLPEYYYT